MQRGGLPGRRGVRGEDDLGDGRLGRRLHPPQQLGDPQVLGVDAVDGRQGPPEHVVEAAELVRALERDDVARLLDDAHERPVAALVLADPAARPLGQVEADLAEPDALLDLPDRGDERDCLVVLDSEQVEGQSLCRALADAREPAQLGDQALDRRRLHG